MLSAFLFASASLASDLRIDSVSWERRTGASDVAHVTITWNNAWHDERNHDAAWIHLRYTGSGQMHPYSVPALVADGGHRVRSGTSVAIKTSPDQVGFWLTPPSGHKGTIVCRLEVLLDDEGKYDQVPEMEKRKLTAHGIEMVMIPSGGFWVGDAHPRAIENGAFHMKVGHDQKAAPFRIEDEEQTIAVDEGGRSLLYTVDEHGYRGDGKGPIPAAFPKGVQGFWIMKYELRQGQYADFLNTLHPEATFVRSNIGGREYAEHGGSIVCENGVYRALHPDRACAFVTWDDLCAFADWAGLRPMTELEFEKACRGPQEPKPMEYPWGTASRDNLKRLLDPMRALSFSHGFTEADMTDANRDVSGASYYRVMDLAGNVWERCITVGDSVGRAFTGTHGDGNLGAWASATNADWPKGTTEVLGFGYRGGAYYNVDEPHGSANPYSPIGYRTYAGWGGAYRYKTYSTRFVRTVE